MLRSHATSHNPRRRTWRRLALALPVLLIGFPAQAEPDISLAEKVAQLELRAGRLEDRAAIENLTRAYGYYVDKQLWPEVVALFSSDARVEIAGRGVYKGSKSIDRLFRLAMGGGRIGLADGGLFNHMILQGVVNVADDGRKAKGRWRAFVQIGQHQKFGIWSEGTYENDYVKIDGVWRISGMHFFATYYTPYDQGWAKRALPNNGPSVEHGPDAPPSKIYDVYPGHYVPPFHYPNPVTGRVWTEEDSRAFSTSGQSPAPSGPPIQPGADTPPRSPAGAPGEKQP
jgi:hypothetical protein